MRPIHALLGGALLCVAACSQAPAPKAVTIDPATIKVQAQIALDAAESAVKTYMQLNQVPDDVYLKVASAEDLAEIIVNRIPTILPADLPAATADFLQTINTIVAVLPPGALPPGTKAQITAFEVLAGALPVLIQAEEAAAAAKPAQ